MRMLSSKSLAYLLSAVLVATCSSASFAGTIEWDAGGDGVSTFQEANWVVTDDTGSATLSGLVGSDPPANFVNGAADVEADVIVGGTGTAGGPLGAGNHFDLGDGFGLTVEDDATFFTQSGPRGLRGVAGGATETFTARDNADVRVQFLLDLTASLSDAAVLTLRGGGVGSVNNSTIDLATDWTGSITWPNFAGVSGSSIIGNTTVGGLPAVEGVNIKVLSDGGSGSVLSLIPEPTSALLMVVGLAGFTLPRRKK